MYIFIFFFTCKKASQEQEIFSKKNYAPLSEKKINRRYKKVMTNSSGNVLILVFLSNEIQIVKRLKSRLIKKVPEFAIEKYERVNLQAHLYQMTSRTTVHE